VLTRLGLSLPGPRPTTSGRPRDFSELAATAQFAERSGFDSLWFSGPPLSPGGSAGSVDAGYEAYTFLGALALRTSSARIGALGFDAARRQPSILAKQVTALDVLSSGRAVLGIGVTGPGSETPDRLGETIDICKSMFRASPVDFDGRFFELRGATNRPGPIQDGGPPVLIDMTVPSSGGIEFHKLVSGRADAVVVSGEASEVGPKIIELRSLDRDERHGRSPLSVILLAMVVVDEAETPSRLNGADGLGAGLGGRASRTLISGDPETVASRVIEYREAGIEGIIAELPDAHDHRHLALAGKILGGALAGDVGRR
jgi:alkanesulfonate monooxygenase SsuD/methylene tetrahydromethanopterin reductase-like flavin-dependent oxidoreductase (luciferase family)